ncbi:MAG: flagellar biosynthesis anti-sigma factor FlgM [Nitrospiraceae bacterium]|nr:flagellar biosynthesis anti-sigma factor FlgM [Nitrospiraceae bacterium]
MKIPEINNGFIEQYKINNKPTPGPQKGIKEDAFKEKVSLSSKSRDIELAKKAIEKSPDIRQEKVQTLKKQIKQGTYNVSGEKIAESMLHESLLNMHSLFVDIHK